MHVVHVDLGSFFVAVERQRRPDLRDQPVVVGGQPGGRGLVAAVSREARRAGVRPGMPLAAAAIRCPAATFVDGAFDRYLAAAVDVDATIRRESSNIEWVSIDEVFVGFGPGETSGAAVAAAERIRTAVAGLGFDAACGVAQSKLVALVASRLARPRGVLHILDGYEGRFLAPLKIEMLPDIDPRLAHRLRAAGVRRLGQVSKLTEPQLAAITGRSAGTLLQQAAGTDRSGIRRAALPPPRIFDAMLRAPTNDPELVTGAVRADVERVGRQLRSRALFARGLTLRLRFGDGRSDSRSASLAEPSCLDDALLPVALELLGRLWTGARLVTAVNVSCAGVLAGAPEGALFSA